MLDVSKYVVEHITIECETFESVIEQVSLLADANSISVEPRTAGAGDTIWTVTARRHQRQ